MVVHRGFAILLIGILGGTLFVRQLLALKEPLLYAYGPYEFARSMQTLFGQILRGDVVQREHFLKQYPDWSADRFVNHHVHITELSDASSKAVTTPNNDTLYTSAVLDLSLGPVEVHVPHSNERYLSVAFIDMFGDQIGYIGTRATHGEGGIYWIMSPEQQPEIPDGVKRFDVPFNDLWLLARVFVAREHDLEAAQMKQREISVRPVEPSNLGTPFQVKATSIQEAGNFVSLTNEILGRSTQAIHTKRAASFAQFGIQPSDIRAFERLPFGMRLAWRILTSRIEPLILKEIDARQNEQSGWMIPPLELGQYGVNDQVRAAVSLIGFGALTIEEAMYFRAMTDEKGDILDGHKAYRMMIPAEGVPTDAFWSLSMYQPEEQRLYFYENEINRYAINSASEDLVYQDDGTLSLAMQPERPVDPSLVWLPTPKGPFQMIFRTYLPSEEIRAGR